MNTRNLPPADPEDDKRIQNLVKTFLSENLSVQFRLGALDELKTTLSEPLARRIQYRVPVAIDRCLAEKNPTIQREVALFLGAFGVSLRMEAHGFFSWLSQRVQNSPQDRNEFYLLALSEYCEVGDPRITQNFTPSIVDACKFCLESAESAALVVPALEVLQKVASISVTHFKPHFQDTIDVLVGWSLEPGTTTEIQTKLLDALVSFRAMWISNAEFAVSLLEKFTEDLATVSDVAQKCSFIACFEAVIRGLGPMASVCASECVRKYLVTLSAMLDGPSFDSSTFAWISRANQSLGALCTELAQTWPSVFLPHALTFLGKQASVANVPTFSDTVSKVIFPYTSLFDPSLLLSLLPALSSTLQTAKSIPQTKSAQREETFKNFQSLFKGLCVCGSWTSSAAKELRAKSVSLIGQELNLIAQGLDHHAKQTNSSCGTSPTPMPLFLQVLAKNENTIPPLLSPLLSALCGVIASIGLTQPQHRDGVLSFLTSIFSSIDPFSLETIAHHSPANITTLLKTLLSVLRKINSWIFASPTSDQTISALSLSLSSLLSSVGTASIKLQCLLVLQLFLTPKESGMESGEKACLNVLFGKPSVQETLFESLWDPSDEIELQSTSLLSLCFECDSELCQNGQGVMGSEARARVVACLLDKSMNGRTFEVRSLASEFIAKQTMQAVVVSGLWPTLANMPKSLPQAHQLPIVSLPMTHFQQLWQLLKSILTTPEILPPISLANESKKDDQDPRAASIYSILQRMYHGAQRFATEPAKDGGFKPLLSRHALLTWAINQCSHCAASFSLDTPSFDLQLFLTEIESLVPQSPLPPLSPAPTFYLLRFSDSLEKKLYMARVGYMKSGSASGASGGDMSSLSPSSPSALLLNQPAVLSAYLNRFKTAITRENPKLPTECSLFTNLELFNQLKNLSASSTPSTPTTPVRPISGNLQPGSSDRSKHKRSSKLQNVESLSPGPVINTSTPTELSSQYLTTYLALLSNLVELRQPEMLSGLFSTCPINLLPSPIVSLHAPALLMAQTKFENALPELEKLWHEVKKDFGTALLSETPTTLSPQIHMGLLATVGGANLPPAIAPILLSTIETMIQQCWSFNEDVKYLSKTIFGGEKRLESEENVSEQELVAAMKKLSVFSEVSGPSVAPDQLCPAPPPSPPPVLQSLLPSTPSLLTHSSLLSCALNTRPNDATGLLMSPESARVLTLPENESSVLSCLFSSLSSQDLQNLPSIFSSKSQQISSDSAISYLGAQMISACAKDGNSKSALTILKSITVPHANLFSRALAQLCLNMHATTKNGLDLSTNQQNLMKFVLENFGENSVVYKCASLLLCDLITRDPNTAFHIQPSAFIPNANFRNPFEMCKSILLCAFSNNFVLPQQHQQPNFATKMTQERKREESEVSGGSVVCSMAADWFYEQAKKLDLDSSENDEKKWMTVSQIAPDAINSLCQLAAPVMAASQCSPSQYILPLLKKAQKDSKFAASELMSLLPTPLPPGVTEDAVAQCLNSVVESIQKSSNELKQAALNLYAKHLVANGSGHGSTSVNALARSSTLHTSIRVLSLLSAPSVFKDTVYIDTLLSLIPSRTWIPVLPQIFSLLQNSGTSSTDLQKVFEDSIVAKMVKENPEAVVYPICVGAEIESKGTKDGQVSSTPLSRLSALLSQSHPSVTSSVQSLIRELNRISCLMHEMWSQALQRCWSKLNHAAEAMKEWLKANERSGDPVLFEQKWSEVFCGVREHLNEVFNMTIGQVPETPHEQEFISKHAPHLSALLALLACPPPDQSPHSTIDFLVGMYKEQAHVMNTHGGSKRESLNLEKISPKLAALNQRDLPLPSPDPSLHSPLSSISHDIQILPTKTKPKKMTFFATDGRKHTFLLKGREDLRLDQRIMQFLDFVNSCFLPRGGENRGCLPTTVTHENIRARNYNVTPLSERSGLIRWVDDTTPLFTLYRNWHVRKQNMAKTSAPFRPIDGFTKRAKAFGLPSENRSTWPLEKSKQIYKELVADAPKDIVEKAIWLSSVDPRDWLSKSTTFARSLALMSVVGYLLGLGDRHLDNVLLDLSTGEVVHIDYNLAFETATALRIPERVPYRLTPSLVQALGPFGVQGPFLKTCEIALSTFVSSKEHVLQLLESFVHDPIVSWESANAQEFTRLPSMDVTQSHSALQNLTPAIQKSSEDFCQSVEDSLVKISGHAPVLDVMEQGDLDRLLLRARSALDTLIISESSWSHAIASMQSPPFQQAFARTTSTASSEQPFPLFYDKVTIPPTALSSFAPIMSQLATLHSTISASLPQADTHCARLHAQIQVILNPCLALHKDTVEESPLFSAVVSNGSAADRNGHARFLKASNSAELWTIVSSFEEISDLLTQVQGHIVNKGPDFNQMKVIPVIEALKILVVERDMFIAHLSLLQQNEFQFQHLAFLLLQSCASFDPSLAAQLNTHLDAHKFTMSQKVEKAALILSVINGLLALEPCVKSAMDVSTALQQAYYLSLRACSLSSSEKAVQATVASQLNANLFALKTAALEPAMSVLSFLEGAIAECVVQSQTVRDEYKALCDTGRNLSILCSVKELKPSKPGLLNQVKDLNAQAVPLAQQFQTQLVSFLSSLHTSFERKKTQNSGGAENGTSAETGIATSHSQDSATPSPPPIMSRYHHLRAQQHSPNVGGVSPPAESSQDGSQEEGLSQERGGQDGDVAAAQPSLEEQVGQKDQSEKSDQSHEKGRVFAHHVLNVVRSKLFVNETDSHFISNKVRILAQEAMSADNLARMYEGWTPWI